MILTKLLPVFIPFLIVGVFAILFIVLIKYYAKTSIDEIEKGDRDIEFINSLKHNKLEKVIKRKKIIKVVRNVLFYALLVVIIPFFAFSLINRLQNNTTMIGNHAMMVVGSGSMSFKNEKNPYLNDDSDTRFNYQFDYGDIIILEKVSSDEELSLYDVICYYNPEKGLNIIHRIINVKESTPIKYVTRGDANDTSDTYESTLSDIVGIYNGKVLKKVGLFILFLQSFAGIITILCLLICLFTFDYFNKKIGKAKSNRCHLLDIVTCENINELQKSEKESKQIINYKGYNYHFDEDGNFIKLEEINQSNLEEKGV